MPLKNARHQRFAEEFVVDRNATAAYKRAGYAGDGNGAQVNAYKLRHRPDIVEEIDRLERERSKRVQVNADRILEEAVSIALADVTELFNDDGTLKKLSELSPGAKRALSALKFEAHPGKGIVMVDFKHHDKMRAIETLLKHVRPESTAPAGGTSVAIDVAKVATMTDEEIDRGIQNVEKMIAALASNTTLKNPAPPA